MKFIKIEGSNVPRYVNFDAVRFLWIETFDDDFCNTYDCENERFNVVAEHDIYLRAFPTYEEAESYINDLVAMLNKEATK